MPLKSRNFGLILAWLAISLGLVALATFLAAESTATSAHWLQAQRDTPLLWLYDGLTPLLTGMMLASLAQDRSRKAQTLALREEHRKQMEALLARTEELEIRSQGYQEQIAGLETAARTRDQELETQARRLTDTAFQALQGQMEANGRQLDAVNLALQYHRAEITQLRHGLHVVQSFSEPARVTRLTPTESAAISAEFAPALSASESVVLSGDPPKPPHQTIAPPVTVDTTPQPPEMEKYPSQEAAAPDPTEGLILPQEVHKNAGSTFVAPLLHFEVEENTNGEAASPPGPPPAATNTWHIKI